MRSSTPSRTPGEGRVIVVVGSLVCRPVDGGAADAAGRSVAIARAARAAGAEVQVVGKVGDDAAGDALVVALGREGIGHAAVLRDPAHPTPLAAGASGETAHDSAGPTLEAADLELALRYLPGIRVVVAAEPLEPAVAGVLAAGASWAGARLVAVVGGAGPAAERTDGAGLAAELPDDATLLAEPSSDPGGAFSLLVGRYAAGLDAGEDPAAAFRAAAAGVGWEATGVGLRAR